ncbi:alpha/beta fold hydrolase [Tamlana crocina]|uniref:Alpha/beta hydrolase n=1 Tax=Tamlana crocina TaxID=393006 RepID=A0ABX1DBT4_9FLAO|nr:alpha/beta hydrolase [Tamlana crocina]NJX14737.1 alpha/beta hydrolase [Tamlana crocina]
MNNIKIVGFLINLLSYLSPSLSAKIAVKLFSTPRKAALTHEGSSYLKTAKQQNLSFNDFEIQTYQWEGHGKTVLLVHGWDSNSFRWKDLIELLKQDGYNIISIDAPAHGASGNNIFNAPLYSECINIAIKTFKPEIVIGHSIGGTATAIALKNHNAPSVEQIVLLGAPSNLAISVGNYVNMMDYNQRVEKAINQYYLKHFNQLPEFYNVENFFSNITPEGLIIHDKKDRIISFKEALDIHRAYKNSKLIKTKGLGHRLKSETVYQHILDFLNA